MMPALAKHRRKTRRKVNDCLYYRTRVDTLSFTLPKAKARQMRQVAKEFNLKLSTYIRNIAVAHTEGYQPVPARIERALEKLQVLAAQVGTTLLSIDERFSRFQKSFIFDPLEAKQRLEKLIDRLEHFIRNPSSLDDC